MSEASRHAAAPNLITSHRPSTQAPYKPNAPSSRAAARPPRGLALAVSLEGVVVDVHLVQEKLVGVLDGAVDLVVDVAGLLAGVGGHYFEQFGDAVRVLGVRLPDDGEDRFF
ncbi:hypothetical protein BC938DRAFT_471024 [Jimgerdemannia flammicorona]|uniref:Uncharacterized protein n=1 Tax=Jimgerdemannia flammicorona TaxID=994334 RepID=A0A433Q8Z4_9FUNG|nr:hypothetical protein BC938DRAFT_471024 [Jimgerdemannia flammicorona]